MAFDDREYRSALGRYPTGVTVVTVDDGGAAAGITVNSFVSISLDPPIVAWSLGLDSARYALFASADAFAVNVLAHDQEDVARAMAQSTRLEGAAAWSRSDAGAPLIAGCVARFSCSAHDRIEAGDHLIILGRVLGFDQEERPALTYHRSSYGRIG